MLSVLVQTFCSALRSLLGLAKHTKGKLQLPHKDLCVHVVSTVPISPVYLLLVLFAETTRVCRAVLRCHVSNIDSWVSALSLKQRLPFYLSTSVLCTSSTALYHCCTWDLAQGALRHVYAKCLMSTMPVLLMHTGAILNVQCARKL